jgi:hypothetical protein
MFWAALGALSERAGVWRPSALRRRSRGAGVQFCARRSDFKGLGFFFCNSSEQARPFDALCCSLVFIYKYMIYLEYITHKVEMPSGRKDPLMTSARQKGEYPNAAFHDHPLTQTGIRPMRQLSPRSMPLVRQASFKNAP